MYSWDCIFLLLQDMDLQGWTAGDEEGWRAVAVAVAVAEDC
jgi:hypothetical protein